MGFQLILTTIVVAVMNSSPQIMQFCEQTVVTGFNIVISIGLTLAVAFSKKLR